MVNRCLRRCVSPLVGPVREVRAIHYDRSSPALHSMVPDLVDMGNPQHGSGFTVAEAVMRALGASMAGAVNHDRLGFLATAPRIEMSDTSTPAFARFWRQHAARLERNSAHCEFYGLRSPADLPVYMVACVWRRPDERPAVAVGLGTATDLERAMYRALCESVPAAQEHLPGDFDPTAVVTGPVIRDEVPPRWHDLPPAELASQLAKTVTTHRRLHLTPSPRVSNPQNPRVQRP